MTTTKHRLILPIQAKGNVGKSIEATARACWLNERGIHWQGFDLDGDNKTLSRLFPAQTRPRSQNANVRRQRTRKRAFESSRGQHHAASAVRICETAARQVGDGPPTRYSVQRSSR